MFDGSLPEPAVLHSLDDAALDEAIQGWNRASAASDARRLAVIAEKIRRRCGDPDDERNWWACDPTDSAAAEVAAALNIGHGRAITQLKLAAMLSDRLPAINAMFLAGVIPLTMVSTLMWRTLLVDEDVLDLLDAALAEVVVRWGPLSEKKLEQAIDLLIEAHDPNAVRRFEQAARKRDVTFGDPDDATGTTAIYGRLLATDAQVMKKRLNLMAHSVCRDDPRTMGQRRADATGAVMGGSDYLACRCGGTDCPAKPDDGRASNVHIHIVGDPSLLDAQPDPNMHGESPYVTPGPEYGPARSPEPEPQPATPPSFTAEVRRPPAIVEPAPESEAEAEPVPLPHHAAASDLYLRAAKPASTTPNPFQPCRRGAGVILGGAIVPAALLAELIRNGATVTFVREPGPDPESRYTPSAKLAEFVRMRDMTCRFPGCDLPADRTTSTTPCRGPTAPPTPATSSAIAENITTSKPGGSATGLTNNHPTVPSSSPAQRARPTPPNPLAVCCFQAGTPSPRHHRHAGRHRHGHPAATRQRQSENAPEPKTTRTASKPNAHSTPPTTQQPKTRPRRITDPTPGKPTRTQQKTTMNRRSEPSRLAGDFAGDGVQQFGIALGFAMSAGFPTADHSGSQAALRVCPDCDVDQTGMAERRRLVAAEGAKPLRPQHVSGTPAHRHQTGRDVGTQPPRGSSRRIEGLGLHNPHPVEFPAAAQHLGETGKLVGGRDGAGRRDDTGEKLGRIGERDDLLGGPADGQLERRGDGRRQRFTGRMAGRDERNILWRNTVIRPAEPERVEDLVGQHVADILAGRGGDDLAGQRAPGQGVIHMHQPWRVNRLQVAEHLAGVVAVVHPP